LHSFDRTNPNLFQRLMVEGTSVASLHASDYILCTLTYERINNAAEARDAIRTLNGSVHGGRALIVNEARPKLYRSGDHESLPSRDHRRHRI
jgi:hypothetical protein